MSPQSKRAVRYLVFISFSPALVALLILVAFFLTVPQVTARQLAEHKANWHGRWVCVDGTVHGLRHKTSQIGNRYTVFQLYDKTSRIRVFTFGWAGLEDGDSVQVVAIYRQHKEVSGYVFSHELDASSMLARIRTCRD